MDREWEVLFKRGINTCKDKAVEARGRTASDVATKKSRDPSVAVQQYQQGLSSDELRAAYKEVWHGSQKDFCNRMDINAGNFSSWLKVHAWLSSLPLTSV